LVPSKAVCGLTVLVTLAVYAVKYGDRLLKLRGTADLDPDIEPSLASGGFRVTTKDQRRLRRRIARLTFDMSSPGKGPIEGRADLSERLPLFMGIPTEITHFQQDGDQSAGLLAERADIGFGEMTVPSRQRAHHAPRCEPSASAAKIFEKAMASAIGSARTGIYPVLRRRATRKAAASTRGV